MLAAPWGRPIADFLIRVHRVCVYIKGVIFYGLSAAAAKMMTMIEGVKKESAWRHDRAPSRFQFRVLVREGVNVSWLQFILL